MRKPLLRIENLSLENGRGEPVLDRLSLSVARGEIYALVGESGSGKTLTSLATMGLLPAGICMRGGEIYLDDTALLSRTEAQMCDIRGKRIAMIFQEPMSALNPVMRIGEQIAEAIRLHMRLGRQQAKERVVKLLEEVGIDDAAQRYDWYPHQFSGGQKQRVVIAMALACDPEVIVADEPTTALDVTVQAQILALLRESCRKRGTAMLFITHDLAVAASLSDRIGVLRKGVLVEEAATSRFFVAAKHPYSRMLLDAVMPKKNDFSRVEKSALLRVENLSVRFAIRKGWLKRTVGYTEAVRNASLTLRRGETLALVGESGSGKSTLAKAILKLVTPSEGAVYYKQKRIDRLSAKDFLPYRRKIQMIFQDPYAALNPRMRIDEIISEGMRNFGLVVPGSDDERERLKALMRRVELDERFLSRYPHALSGGQRQRVVIARALAVEPEVIVCDEPTSALDVRVRGEILKLLERIQEETAVSYLFITHDLSIVPQLAHRVAVMYRGRIVSYGTPDEVMRHPEEPYTRRLMQAAPKLPRIERSER